MEVLVACVAHDLQRLVVALDFDVVLKASHATDAHVVVIQVLDEWMVKPALHAGLRLRLHVLRWMSVATLDAAIGCRDGINVGCVAAGTHVLLDATRLLGFAWLLRLGLLHFRLRRIVPRILPIHFSSSSSGMMS